MSRSDNELLELCMSNNLSLVALQETINTLGPRVSSQQMQSQLCFHHACRNKKVTLEIVQLLYSIWPGALRLGDDEGCRPIHNLCRNRDLDDTASFEILRFMLNIDPTLSRELDGQGCLPVYFAVMNKSTAFCKELIDGYPESLRIDPGDGRLPIHFACAYGNRDDTADTIQYMLELDSELINEEDSDGLLPIHRAARSGMTKSIELLLKFDPDATSKEVNDGGQQLSLHLVCGGYTPNLSKVQLLYDIYPEAILARDRYGDTPLDLARADGNQSAIEFLQTQLVYARQAQDVTAMATGDENGWLPLHHALKDDAPLGSIKLLVMSNPAAMQVSDQNGVNPVHIACKFSSVKLVKYLVVLAGDTLNNVDANKDSPLHYACRGGNLNVVKHLLEANVPSVSERNNDNKLAIHLLLECVENTLDRDCLEYVETVWQLLLANPEVVRDFTPH